MQPTKKFSHVKVPKWVRLPFGDLQHGLVHNNMTSYISSKRLHFIPSIHEQNMLHILLYKNYPSTLSKSTILVLDGNIRV
jgi:hypothetical protein